MVLNTNVCHCDVAGKCFGGGCMKLKVEIDKESREMDKNRLGEKVTI